MGRLQVACRGRGGGEQPAGGWSGKARAAEQCGAAQDHFAWPITRGRLHRAAGFPKSNTTQSEDQHQPFQECINTLSPDYQGWAGLQPGLLTEISSRTGLKAQTCPELESEPASPKGTIPPLYNVIIFLHIQIHT